MLARGGATARSLHRGSTVGRPTRSTTSSPAVNSAFMPTRSSDGSGSAHSRAASRAAASTAARSPGGSMTKGSSANDEARVQPAVGVELGACEPAARPPPGRRSAGRARPATRCTTPTPTSATRTRPSVRPMASCSPGATLRRSGGNGGGPSTSTSPHRCACACTSAGWPSSSAHTRGAVPQHAERAVQLGEHRVGVDRVGA